MVTLPAVFVATRVPGYFYHTENNSLYSIKTGVLKQLKRHPYYSRYYGKMVDGYQVSHCGVRQFITTEYLLRLKSGADSVIKVDRTRR